jgi:hypothetical protein
MKPNPKKPFLIALLALLLMALAACGAPQPGQQPSEVSVQPNSPTALPPPADVAQSESADGSTCIDGTPHPIGQSIATTYEVSYEQVMSWFCSGYSFENILIALETSDAVDVPADTLLQMLQEQEWEEIWVEVGFTK